MAKNNKLLLPYAYDCTGKLVHIDNAHKNETYKCPECGKTLSLNISKIPKGEKYHRRNHFSHPKRNSDNHCTESFLHKLFKEKAAKFIEDKIQNNVNEFHFEWICDECSDKHEGNMLKKAKSVYTEHNLGICRPDIVLLDNDGKVVIAIEIVVTHSPSSETLEYYSTKKIACLQIHVSDFDDCEDVENKLAHPDFVNLCPAPICQKCNSRMHKSKMIIVNGICWKCRKDMAIAMIETKRSMHSPANFTEKEIELANRNGANIQLKYSNQFKESYYANVCKYCNAHIGDLYMHNYWNAPLRKVVKFEYKCYECIEQEKRLKEKFEQEIVQKLNENIKYCPKCRNKLVLRKGRNGYFYGCKNFPNCHYTENIELETAQQNT